MGPTRGTGVDAAGRGAEGGGPRFMFYSHDGVGLGHFRRNLVIARSLMRAKPEATVLLACSADGIETFPLPDGVDVVRLPGLRKVANGRYVARRLRLDGHDIVALRSGLLAAAVASFRPDVLLVDKHPLGVRGELVYALNRLRQQGGRAALGLRDVLDDGPTTLAEWQRSGLGLRAAELYDLALVYGSPTLLDPVAGELLPAQFNSHVRYCGYVVGTAPGTRATDQAPFATDEPIVLATVGGGEDGLPLLETFIEAAHGAAWHGIVVAGPQMAPPDWARLQDAAAVGGVAVYQSIRQVQRWYRRAAALVCMGGYNTLVEALATPIATVCVPRTQPRREQQIRAQAFAAKGLLHVVEPSELSTARLRSAIATALATPRELIAERVRRVLDLGGAQRAAGYLLELAETGTVGLGASIGVSA